MSNRSDEGPIVPTLSEVSRSHARRSVFVCQGVRIIESDPQRRLSVYIETAWNRQMLKKGPEPALPLPYLRYQHSAASHPIRMPPKAVRNESPRVIGKFVRLQPRCDSEEQIAGPNGNCSPIPSEPGLWLTKF